MLPSGLATLAVASRKPCGRTVMPGAVPGRSAINCSLVWGTEDPVATLAVADYVWENYLRNRTSAPATFTKIQGANHYLAVDHAAEVARLVLSSLGF